MTGTRKKAAGAKPAAAIPPAETATETSTAATDLAGVASEAAAPIVLSGDADLSGVAAALAAADGPAAIIIAQQPGQIASALVAPVLDIDTQEGGVTSETALLDDGHPADIEMGGRTVFVQSRSQRGRWRIGRHFTTTPTPVDIDELTEEQVGQLLADPELLVSLDD